MREQINPRRADTTTTQANNAGKQDKSNTPIDVRQEVGSQGHGKACRRRCCLGSRGGIAVPAANRRCCRRVTTGNAREPPAQVGIIPYLLYRQELPLPGKIAAQVLVGAASERQWMQVQPWNGPRLAVAFGRAVEVWEWPCSRTVGYLGMLVGM